MAKYIRTKDKIYKVTNDKFGIIEENGIFKKFCENMGHTWYGELDVISQSDNPVDLCDEFVYVKKSNGNKTIYAGFIAFQRKFSTRVEIAKATESDLYGGIWTDKGLIYVAKMNEKGEFELI